jgi:hypothetical protein
VDLYLAARTSTPNQRLIAIAAGHRAAGHGGDRKDSGPNIHTR